MELSDSKILRRVCSVFCLMGQAEYDRGENCITYITRLFTCYPLVAVLEYKHRIFMAINVQEIKNIMRTSNGLG